MVESKECVLRDKVSQALIIEVGKHLRIRVGCVTLVRVSNGTIQSVAVSDQEQTEEDDYTIDSRELTVDGFDTSNTGRRKDVLVGIVVLIVALTGRSRVKDMLVVAGNGRGVLGRVVVRVFLVSLGRHVEGREIRSDKSSECCRYSGSGQDDLSTTWVYISSSIHLKK